MLIHSLGIEGQCIFHTLGPTQMYADCVFLPNGHFAVPQSVIVRRIIVHQSRQRPGVSPPLRCCKFSRLEEEMIQDQLVEHTTNPKLWEKLLMSPDHGNNDGSACGPSLAG